MCKLALCFRQSELAHKLCSKAHRLLVRHHCQPDAIYLQVIINALFWWWAGLDCGRLTCSSELMVQTTWWDMNANLSPWREPHPICVSFHFYLVCSLCSLCVLASHTLAYSSQGSLIQSRSAHAFFQLSLPLSLVLPPLSPLPPFW